MKPLTEDDLVELGFEKKLMAGTGWTSISSMTPAVYYYTRGRITINATEMWTWFLDGKQRNDIAVGTRAGLMMLIIKHMPVPPATGEYLICHKQLAKELNEILDAEKRKEYQSKYRKSQKGKSSLKKGQQKYFKTEKGKAASTRSIAKHQAGEQWEESHAKSMSKYSKTDKGRAAHARANKKYYDKKKGMRQ